MFQKTNKLSKKIMFDQTTINKTIKVYNDNAKDYASKFDKWPRPKELKKVFGLCHKTNPRVLELGCANGKDIKEILKRTNNYLGADGAGRLLNIAKNKFPQVNFQISKFEDLNFPEKKFDIVLDFVSLFHLDRRKLGDIINKIYLWLDHDGLLLICAKKGDYKKIINHDQGGKVQYYYQPSDILNLAKDKFNQNYLKIENRYGHDWFTIILKKKEVK